MSRHLAALTVPLAFAAALAAAPAPADSGPVYIDLKPHANVKLKDDFHSGDFPGNNLAGLPAGKQTFAEVKFQVGDGLIQLGSSLVKEKPEKVEGIKVGRLCGKLRFLHATSHNAPDGTVVAKYVVHYDDKTTADVEVAYGRDVVDWWAYPDQKAPTAGKVAWEGENEAAKKYEAKVKLSLMTCENPHPKKKVTTIDFVATAPTGEAAPFCVAITAEEK
jgi:hypothetical protein